MKHILSFLIPLLLMVACGRPSGNTPLWAELQRAEDLMYPHPKQGTHHSTGRSGHCGMGEKLVTPSIKATFSCH